MLKYVLRFLVQHLDGARGLFCKLSKMSGYSNWLEWTGSLEFWKLSSESQFSERCVPWSTYQKYQNRLSFPIEGIPHSQLISVFFPYPSAFPWRKRPLSLAGFPATDDRFFDAFHDQKMLVVPRFHGIQAIPHDILYGNIIYIIYIYIYIISMGYYTIWMDII